MIRFATQACEATFLLKNCLCKALKFFLDCDIIRTKAQLTYFSSDHFSNRQSFLAHVTTGKTDKNKAQNPTTDIPATPPSFFDYTVPLFRTSPHLSADTREYDGNIFASRKTTSGTHIAWMNRMSHTENKKSTLQISRSRSRYIADPIKGIAT